LRGFPDSSHTLRALADGVRRSSGPTWGEAWASTVRAAVLRMSGQN